MDGRPCGEETAYAKKSIGKIILQCLGGGLLVRAVDHSFQGFLLDIAQRQDAKQGFCVDGAVRVAQQHRGFIAGKHLRKARGGFLRKGAIMLEGQFQGHHFDHLH